MLNENNRMLICRKKIGITQLLFEAICFEKMKYVPSGNLNRRMKVPKIAYLV